MNKNYKVPYLYTYFYIKTQEYTKWSSIVLVIKKIYNHIIYIKNIFFKILLKLIICLVNNHYCKKTIDARNMPIAANYW